MKERPMLRDDSKIPLLSFGRGDGVNTMCGMQAVSWQSGDTVITDDPKCSSRYLSRLVQYLNDELADDESGFLSARDSMDVLDLGWLTVGTGDAGDEVAHRWFAELLDNPRWGVVRFLRGADRETCKAGARAHRMAAEGRDVQWADDYPPHASVGKRNALERLSMYVVEHAAGSGRSLESAASMACHANFYYASSKAERVRWVRNAIESWLSWQKRRDGSNLVARRFFEDNPDAKYESPWF
jgi:hypothetical protein